MPRVDATIDDDVFALIEAEAKRDEISKAALVRNIIQSHYSEQPAVAKAFGSDAVIAKIESLQAMVYACAKYLCMSRPLDDRMLPEEAEMARKSWEKLKEWSKAG